MRLPNARRIRHWHDEVLAERVVTFAGPDVAVVRVHPRTDADEQGPDRRVWRATAVCANLRRIPVNTAVSQILAQLIREHYWDKDWAKAWDYHVEARHLLAASGPFRSGRARATAQEATG